jgi:hypothetical protein
MEPTAPAAPVTRIGLPCGDFVVISITPGSFQLFYLTRIFADCPSPGTEWRHLGKQPAKSWELPCGDEYGAALARSGQGAASARTSRSVYGWFNEGFDTLDLKEAMALLDELHA